MAKTELVRVLLAFDSTTDTGKTAEYKIQLDQDFTASRLSVSDYTEEVKINILDAEVGLFNESVELVHFKAGADGAYRFATPKVFKANVPYYVKGNFTGTGQKKVSLVFHP